MARLGEPGVAAAFTRLAVAGEIALTAPVIFELGVAARGPADHEAVMDRLGAYDYIPTTDADHRRALEIQALMAEKSQHRQLSLVDALVAAVAGARQLIVLHYDGDFEAVAELTGQAQRWIVERGTAD